MPEERDTKNHAILNALLSHSYRTGYSAGVSALAAQQAIDPPPPSAPSAPSASTPPAPEPIPQSTMAKDLPRRYSPDSCSPGYPAEPPPAGIRPTLIMTALAGGSLWFALRTRRRVKGLEKNIRDLNSGRRAQGVDKDIFELKASGPGGSLGGGTRDILAKSPAKVGSGSPSNVEVGPLESSTSKGQGLWSQWSLQRDVDKAGTLPIPSTASQSTVTPSAIAASSSDVSQADTIDTAVSSGIQRHDQSPHQIKSASPSVPVNPASEDKGNERDQFEIDPASIPPAKPLQPQHKSDHIFSVEDIHKAMADLRLQHTSSSSAYDEGTTDWQKKTKTETETKTGTETETAKSPGSRHESVTTSKRKLAEDINAARLEIEGEQAIGENGSAKAEDDKVDVDNGSTSPHQTGPTPALASDSQDSNVPSEDQDSPNVSSGLSSQAETVQKSIRSLLETATQTSDAALLSSAAKQEQQMVMYHHTLMGCFADDSLQSAKTDHPSSRQPLQPAKREEDGHLFSVGDIHKAMQELSGRHASSIEDAKAGATVKEESATAEDSTKNVSEREAENQNSPSAQSSAIDTFINTPVSSPFPASEQEAPITRASLARMYKSQPVNDDYAAPSGSPPRPAFTVKTGSSTQENQVSAREGDDNGLEGAATGVEGEEGGADVEKLRRKREKNERRKARKLERRQEEMSGMEKDERVVKHGSKGESTALLGTSSLSGSKAVDNPPSTSPKFSSSAAKARGLPDAGNKQVEQGEEAGPNPVYRTEAVHIAAKGKWFFLLKSSNFTPSPPSSAPSAPSPSARSASNAAGCSSLPGSGAYSYSSSFYSSVSHRLGHLSSAAYSFGLPTRLTPASSPAASPASASPTLRPAPRQVEPGNGSPVYGTPVEEVLLVFKRKTEEDVGRDVLRNVAWGKKGKVGSAGWQSGTSVGSGTGYKCMWTDEVSTWQTPTYIRPSHDGRHGLVYLDGHWREAKVVKELKSAAESSGSGGDGRGIWMWTVDV
ncbi:hypothetical protein IAR50_006640 [Cryptococcus sp. DSM 104548]